MADNLAPPELDQILSGEIQPLSTSTDQMSSMDQVDQSEVAAPVTPPPPELNDLITPAEIREAEFGDIPQKALTAAEAAGNLLTVGNLPRIENYIGKKYGIEEFSPERMQAREQENPGSRIVGGLATLPIGGVLAKLGAPVAAGLAQVGTGVGVGEAAAGLAGSLGVESLTAKGLIGAAVSSIPITLGEINKRLYFQDPELTTQSAISSLGLNAVFSGIAGAALGKVSSLWAAKNAAQTENYLNQTINEAAQSAQTDQSVLKEVLKDPKSKGLYDAGLLSTKPNWESIEGASNFLKNKGYDVDLNDFGVGLKSNSEFVKTLSAETAKRPTIPGVLYGQRINKASNRIVQAAEDTFNEAYAGTRVEANEEITKSIQKELGGEYAALKKEYNDFEPVLVKLKIDPLKKEAISTLILENPAIAKGSKLENVAEKWTNDLKNQDNLLQLKLYRTDLNDEITKSYINKNTNDRIYVLEPIKKTLDKLLADTITDASNAIPVGEEIPGQVKMSDIQSLRDLNSRYAAFKTKLTSFGKAAGIGKVSGTDQLLNKVEFLKDHALVDKIFNVNKTASREVMQASFPEQYELARKAKLAELLQDSKQLNVGGNEEFNINKYINQTNKLSPEAKADLFKDMIGQHDAVVTMSRAYPSIVSKSGTPFGIAFGNLFSPQGVIDNISDAIKVATLKGLPYLMESTGASNPEAATIGLFGLIKNGQSVNAEAFKAAVDYIDASIKGETLLSDATKNIFKTLPAISNKFQVDDRTIKKLEKKLDDIRNDPSHLFDVGGNVSEYLPDHGMTVVQTATAASNYLNSLKPVTRKDNPLDRDLEPNKIDYDNYINALKIAAQPISVLSKVKDGTITNQDIQHLNGMYPKLYEKMQSQIMHQMMKEASKGLNIPYQTRLGISMFTKVPLDGSMTQSSILSLQPGLNPANQNQMMNLQIPGTTGTRRGSFQHLDRIVNQNLTPAQSRIRARQGRF